MMSEAAAIKRLVEAEVLLTDLATGYWHSCLNEDCPMGNMGDRIQEYWKRRLDEPAVGTNEEESE